MHNSKDLHMEVVIQILRYLKLTSNSSILFQKTGRMTFSVYIDAR